MHSHLFLCPLIQRCWSKNDGVEPHQSVSLPRSSTWDSRPSRFLIPWFGPESNSVPNDVTLQRARFFPMMDVLFRPRWAVHDDGWRLLPWPQDTQSQRSIYSFLPISKLNFEQNGVFLFPRHGISFLDSNICFHIDLRPPCNLEKWNGFAHERSFDCTK